MDESINKALVSLKGLSIGDSLGEQYSCETSEILQKIKNRVIPEGIWQYTDDTQMAISVVDTLINHNEIDQDYLADRFLNNFEIKRGYGQGTIRLINYLKLGHDWRIESKKLFNNQGSYGNGAAMRSAPIGAYFKDDIKKVYDNAVKQAEITHAHLEGITGAAAIALAASYSANLKTENDYNPGIFFDFIIDHIPESITRQGIIKAKKLKTKVDIQTAAKELGTGHKVSSQDTVPFTIWCSAKNIFDFVEAFWTTVEQYGDRDTICAMVCSIVVLSTHTPIPIEWLERVENLPIDLFLFE